MRNFTLGLVALLVVALGSAASLAGDRRVVVDVPFAFTVGERTLPAGRYLVEQEPPSGSFFTIRNVEGGRGAVVLGGAVVDRDGATRETAIVFTNYRGEHFLSEIFMPNRAAGNVIKRSDQEKELSARVSASRVLVAATR